MWKQKYTRETDLLKKAPLINYIKKETVDLLLLHFVLFTSNQHFKTPLNNQKCCRFDSIRAFCVVVTWPIPHF